MRKLILVKHAQPLVRPEIPADQWRLCDDGRRKCEPLATHLSAHQPAAIVSSVEPKAHETARIVAGILNVPVKTAGGLHEHDRGNVPHMRSSEFLSHMALFFQRPDELVLGLETASATRQRFSAAVGRVMDEHADGNVVIVSHGTVLALYLAKLSGEAPFALWRRMRLPSYAVLPWPANGGAEVVAQVG